MTPAMIFKRFFDLAVRVWFDPAPESPRPIRADRNVAALDEELNEAVTRSRDVVIELFRYEQRLEKGLVALEEMEAAGQVGTPVWVRFQAHFDDLLARYQYLYDHGHLDPNARPAQLELVG